MRQTLSLRRVLILLGILPFAALLAACQQQPASPNPAPAPGSASASVSAAPPPASPTPVAPKDCSEISPGDAFGPQVCIDPATSALAAKPDPVRAHARNHGNDVTIRWIVPGSHRLNIIVAQSKDGTDCVSSQPTCSGAQCSAPVNPAAADKAHPEVQCKYTVSVQGDKGFPKANDPIIIVDNCCPM